MNLFEKLFGTSKVPPASKTSPEGVKRPSKFTLETEADTKALQQFLVDLGYLEAGSADGRWGGTSAAMLGDLMGRNGTVAAGMPEDVRAGEPLPGAAVVALGRAKPLPMMDGDSNWLNKIVRIMMVQNLPIVRSPACYNIVAIEGHDPGGKRNNDRRDCFNDVKIVFGVNDEGKLYIAKEFVATTTPGTYWTTHPMDGRGAFNIALGYQKAWTLGAYHGVPALLQVENLKGFSDKDRKGVRDLRNPRPPGLYGVHHHHGTANKESMGRSSAGCQVIMGNPAGGRHPQLDFIDLVTDDVRYTANHGYRFGATVLAQADIPE